jgi:methylmalonyl-CoA epimerase
VSRQTFIGASEEITVFRKIDHIAVAVRSIAGSARFYNERLGLPLGAIETVASEGVRVAFLGQGETHLELLEPIDETGPVARFIERRGEGLHHVCFEVERIDSVVEGLRKAGIRLTGDAPRPGAGGSRVAFVHPKEVGGLLIELAEKPVRRVEREPERIVPGQAVVVYLRDPKERFWGILREINVQGTTVEGVELASFDPWVASASKGEGIGSASCVLFPVHRIERILLDRPSTGAESLDQRFRARVGCSLATFLARSG